MNSISVEDAAIFKYVKNRPDVDDLDNVAWLDAGEISITDNWSGQPAPAGRSVKAGLLWSDAALHVRFDAVVAEPLVINSSTDVSKKTIGLWDRDVCEIFVAPDRAEPNRYFEFEAAPTGEWLDVGIELKAHERLSDWCYASGIKCSALIEESRVLMAMEIPWQAFGRMPKPGDIWLGNLFRCVGTGAERGYLSWKATRTEHPNFHVPSAFGEFIFIK